MIKFLFHNKIEIFIGNKNYVFYNKMLPSVYSAIKNLKKFNHYISIGNGSPSEKQNNFKLTSHIKTFECETEFLQNDISNELIFVTKNLVISPHELNVSNITEIGFSDGDLDSPTIYNYFSLINTSSQNGLEIKNDDQIYIKLTIYLTIENASNSYLTLGDNKFVSFLLGEGLCDSVYVTQGNNNVDNIKIKRESPLSQKFPCEFEFNENNSLTLNFSYKYLTNKTYELVFLIGNEPFARLNVQNFKNTTLETTVISPKTNYVIDLSSDIKTHLSVKNLSTGESERNTFSKHYATEFGDQISLPFNGLFSYETPRFLSKDGNKIFFVSEDTLYAYKNENYQLLKIKTGDIFLQEIYKIIAFDNFVFVIKKIEPYIEIFKIQDNCFNKINFDTGSFENITIFSKIFDIDITMSKTDIFQIAIIDNEDYLGHMLYCNFDENSNTFSVTNYQVSNYHFSYVLCMYQNNFSDSFAMFLKSGEHSNDCRIVEFYPDQTTKDTYSVLAYYYTHETKEIYAKNRAIVVEKTSSPKLWIYYYPQMYRYNLNLLETEENSYLSTNLLYLIQKDTSSNFKFYNLVGYDSPTEFTNRLPIQIDQNEIIDFEFLEDTLLVFLKNKSIYAFNLKQTEYLIENVSSNEDLYEISYEKYNLLGDSGEQFKVSFEVTITI